MDETSFGVKKGLLMDDESPLTGTLRLAKKMGEKKEKKIPKKKLLLKKELPMPKL